MRYTAFFGIIVGMDGSKKVIYLLFLGLLATSFPAILVRFADAPAITISFYRNIIAAGLIFPLIFLHKTKISDFRHMAIPVLTTSCFLALHFWTWNASLKMTSVASSLVIVATQPVWSAILGRMFLKENVSKRGWLSIFIALSGIAAIAMTDIGASAGSIRGDLLALAAAIFASLYLVMGRSVRDKIPILYWLFTVYFCASLILFIPLAISKAPMGGFTTTTWLMFFLMGLIPSAVGHSLLNYSVRFIEAYKAQLGLLLEPLVSSILAFAIFMEKPPAAFYPGALLALFGVVLGISERGRTKSLSGNKTWPRR
ncbi:MAG TPA: DMT family transporter [Acidobacteriota bacterium]|nr:DMT family transporter [Acidobacteriota bacterium]HQQ47545.1 DMT family transporter [Acidobacteriota bacterium]